MDINCSVNIMKTYGTNMTKLTGAALDRAVANTMGVKSVHNCEDWVGLTDEEILQGNKESWVTLQAWQSAVWWAEAKLKEKNT